MKYLKLFPLDGIKENYKVDKEEFPSYGNSLSSREEIILKDLVGDYLNAFNIKKDDGYYYTNANNIYYNRFDNFNDLKDYIQFNYFISKSDLKSFRELLKSSKLDMSFDDNWAIRWSSENGHTEIVKLLLKDTNVDPSDYYNSAIYWASYYGHKEIVKLLLEDPRVREKLSPEEINKYTNEIS